MTIPVNPDITSPGLTHEQITLPHTFQNLPRSLYFGTAGDVIITDITGATAPYTVVAGAIIPFRGVAIAAGVSPPTNIVAWYL